MRPRSVTAKAVLPALLALLGVVAFPQPAHPQDGAAPSSEQPSSAEPQSPFEQQRERFDGVWELAGTHDAARRTVNQAIEQTVAAMNFFVRSVARGQLQENTPVNRRITLRFQDGERIQVHFSETNFRVASRVGATRRANNDGTEMRVTQRFRGEQLEQVFETDQGTRWNTYTRIGDERLRLDAVTQGMMMPEALRFSLEYRRRAGE